MSWEQLTQSARANMYSGIHSTAVTPPLPPRESSIPLKAMKATPPEVKKKKVKKAESLRTRDAPSNLERELPLVTACSKERNLGEISDSKESVATSSTQDMTLLDFVKTYSCQFPQRIRIINGYCGNSNRLTISANDVYNIHLLKHVRVAKVMDMIGNEYSVPLNTAIEFGLVFDPVGESRGSQQAISGYNLRVSDIFSLSTMPKILCCISAWTSSDGNISLQENEVLVVRGVQKTRMKNKKTMKAFSLLKKKELLVPEHCMALFSTRPRLLKMTLADLIEKVPDPFPNAATIHFADELYHNPTTAALIQDMSDRFLSDIVRVIEVVTESSLIASAVYPEGLPMDEYSGEQVDEFVDIPLEGELLNIEVTTVETDETKIYDDTVNIYEKFNPAKLKSLKEMSSNQASAAQSLFYTAVKEGMEKHGVELDEPTAAYVSMTAKQPAQTGEVSGGKKQNTSVRSIDAEESGEDSDGYETIYHEIEGRGSFPVIGGSGSAEGKHMSGKKSAPTPGFKSTGGNKKQLPSFLLKKSRDNTSVAPPPPPPPPPPPSNDSMQFSPSSPEMSPSISQRQFQASPSHVSMTTQQAVTTNQANQEERFKQKFPLPEKVPSPSRSLEKPPMLSTMPRPHRQSTESSSTEDVGLKIKALEKRLDKMETMIELLEKASRKEQAEMNAQIRKLTQKVQTLQQSPSSGISQGGQEDYQPEEQSDEGKEKNRKDLSKLSLDQILFILDKMELSKYKKVFQDEQLTGDIVLELTDDLLREELEIHSKIHRIRLMKLISGAYSPNQYMPSYQK